VSIFGPLFSTGDLEQAAMETLSEWFETYAIEYALQHDMERHAIALPKSYRTSAQLDRDDGASLPGIVVVSPGLGANKPSQEGDGSYRAQFILGIGAFVSANDRDPTTKLLRMYTAIIRAIILQKQSLKGFACGTEWVDESYDDVFRYPDGQTIQGGQVVFTVEVDGLVNRYGGPPAPTPPDPDTQPGGTWPLAETVSAEIRVKE
jgi:hypothetical protein